jgi:hypothetical protein
MIDAGALVRRGRGLAWPSRASVMNASVGFQVAFWDQASFAAFFVIVVASLTLAVFMLGLPGRIAIARKHPQG